MGLWWNTAQKMKFSIKDFFSKCDQIHRKLHFLVSEDELRSIKGECKGKWGGGISGGFDGSLNKSEEDIWGDEGWENDTCEAGLWAIDFDWKCTVGAVAGNGIITDVVVKMKLLVMLKQAQIEMDIVLFEVKV